MGCTNSKWIEDHKTKLVKLSLFNQIAAIFVCQTMQKMINENPPMTKENMISFSCINKTTYQIPAKIDDINLERGMRRRRIGRGWRQTDGQTYKQGSLLTMFSLQTGPNFEAVIP